MKKTLIIAALLVCGTAFGRKQESMDALTTRVFDLARTQFVLLDENTGDGVIPKSMKPDGTLQTADIRDWVSGFFPGSLWYAYEYTGDESMKELAQKRTLMLEPLIGMKTSHDIGFMINCSYGNALRLTADTETYRSIILQAADKLAARFIPAAGVIRSWDWGKRMGWDTPVIIDNMMNLELLMNADRLQPNPEYVKVATKHANTTISHHFRPDYTCYHVVDYDHNTGEVRRRQTHQGYADESTWARGEAWALYGFTMMYLKTGDVNYFTQADYIAKWLIRNLPEDGIPYWDFDCPGEYRDASAGAIMASAFIKLYEITGRKQFLDIADKQLRTLAGKEYLAAPGTNCGFLLKHSVGHLPGNSEVDVPLSYADYYFLEALLRRQKALSHPRLFLDEKTWEDMRGQIESGENKPLTAIHGTIMKLADRLPDDPLIWKLDESGRRILEVSREAMSRISFDAYAYRYTSDKRYLKHAEKTLEEICSMPDWNGWHFLDIAEMAAAMAVGYDWLYDDLSPELKEKMVGTIKEFAFTEAFDLDKAWFYDKPHNWNQVCNGGLAMAALAFREDCGPVAGNIVRNAVRTNKKQLETIYGPDGCYPEGVSYWGYGNTYQVLLNSSFDSALGDDFGLSGAKGFDRTGDYVIACHGADGKVFNYYDNALEQAPVMPLWYFAWRFDKPWLVAGDVEMLAKDSDWYCRETRMLPFLGAFASRIDTDAIKAPEAAMYVGHGKNPIATVKDAEGKWYLGVKGGTASNNHGHVDEGSFVFDRDGVRWAADLGSVSYTKVENELKAKGGNFWNRGQKSMRWGVFPIGSEWHNTLTVNGERHIIDSLALITSTSDTPELKTVTVNLAPVLGCDIESAVRTVALKNGRTLTVTDSLRAAKDSRIWFTLVSEGEPEFADGEMTLRKDGKSMKVSASGAQFSFSEIESEGAKEKGLHVIRMEYDAKASQSTVTKVVME